MSVHPAFLHALSMVAPAGASDLKPTGLTDKMIAWENGELDEIETAELFQNLIDTGMAWSLQGTYGRMATNLIRAGICHA